MANFIDAGNDGGVSTASATRQFTTPSDTAIGDLFVIEHVQTVTSGANFAFTAEPSGVVALRTPLGASGTSASVAIEYLFATAAGAQTFTWTLDATYVGSTSWLRLRNVDTGTPLSGTYQTSGWIPGTTYTAPAITTAVANSFVVGGLAVASGSRTVAAPSGWTEPVSPAPVRIGEMAYKGEQASAGSSGSAQWGVSGASINGYSWQVAFRPATVTSFTGTAAQTIPAVTTAASATFVAPAATAASVIPAITQAAAGTFSAVAPTLVRTFAGVGTSTSLLVSVKTTSASSIRLKVATNSALTTGVVYSSSVVPDGSGWAKCNVTGLSPATLYYYGVEMTAADTSVSTTASQGDLKTMPAPGAPVSTFTIVHGSCIASGSTSSTAFTRMLARTPDLFLHLGDWHYDDLTTTNQALQLAALEAPLTNSTGLRNLVKDVNTLYIQSDHDMGPNGALPGSWVGAAMAAYKQFTPYTSQGVNSIFDSIVIGRVRLFWTDDRHERTATKYLTDEQWAWMQGQLTQSEPVKIWIQQGPWVGPDPGNSADTPNLAPADGGDKWWNYGPSNGNQFGTVSSWIAANAVGKVITLHGDSHALLADNGTNSPGGIPTIGAAPFDKTSSVKGGPFSQGTYYGPSLGSQVQQYGVTTITDNGSTITVAFTGYDSSNTARVSLNVSTSLVTGTGGSVIGAVSTNGGGNVTTPVAPEIFGVGHNTIPAVTVHAMGASVVPSSGTTVLGVWNGTAIEGVELLGIRTSTGYDLIEPEALGIWNGETVQ